MPKTSDSNTIHPTLESPQHRSDRPGVRRAGKTAAQLIAGGALLSTTALLPAYETKIPPYRGD